MRRLDEFHKASGTNSNVTGMEFPYGKSLAMLEELSRYVVAEPYPFVIDLERCEGMWLATIDGDRIFDWAGYYGSKLIAHNHPRLYEPEYVKRLVRAANNKTANPDLLTPECLEYYRLLHEIAPECMRNPRLEVYAVNSGAEAVENMMAVDGGQRVGVGRGRIADQRGAHRAIQPLSIAQTAKA